jgi:hypothetical protein
VVFIAVVSVAVADTLSIFIFIVIFVFVAMFIVTAPVSMIFMLGKTHAGAERQYGYRESMQPSARFHEFPSTHQAFHASG